MDSIKLHPEHGLNPTVAVCFYCGEETGEIALMGNACKGEAPRRMILSEEPCKKCDEMFKTGFVVLEVSKTSVHKSQSSVDDESGYQLYRTGRYVVLKREAAAKLFELPEERIEKAPGCHLVDDMFCKIFNELIPD